jgi:hypothetical protein
MSQPCFCGAHDCEQCYPAGFDQEPVMDSEMESVVFSMDALGHAPEQDPAQLEALEDDCRRICSLPVYSPDTLAQYIQHARYEVKAKMTPRVAAERYSELGRWVTLLHANNPTQGVADHAC